MKKNSVFERLRKDKKGLFILNIISFLSIFLLLEISTAVVANFTFYSQIDKDLKTFSETIEEGAVIWEPAFGNNNYRVNPNYLISSRLIVIIYEEGQGKIDANLCNDAIVYYLNPEYEGYKSRNDFDSDEEYEKHILEVRESLDKISENPVFKIEESKLNLIHTSRVNNLSNEECFFRNITIEVDTPSLPNAKYAKVLVMTNNEEESIVSIINISITTMILVFILSLFTSYFLSGRAIKPIRESLDKQLAFVSDASHELRTPLAIVQSKLENILAKSDSTVLEVSDDIADSLKEISRLSKLSNDLLMLARDDNERLSLNLEYVDMKQLLINVCEPFVEVMELSEKKMTLQLEEATCSCDPALIKQVLIILLDNANRYTNLNDEVLVKLISNKDETIIEVSDTGIGVSDEAIEHIFERFYREDKARSRETGGNGLGLAIAKSIVKKHKGTIAASHNQPKGTVFTITLPK